MSAGHDVHAGLERHVARAVERVARRLQRVAHDHVVHAARRQAGAVERATRAAAAPRSSADRAARAPPFWPSPLAPIHSAIGVRAPETITTSGSPLDTGMLLRARGPGGSRRARAQREFGVCAALRRRARQDRTRAGGGVNRPRAAVVTCRPMKSHTEYPTLEIPARRAFVNITSEVAAAVRKSGVREGLVLVNAMHISASVFINDDEPGLHRDYDAWLEQLAPHEPVSQYRHNDTGEDNADAHLKRRVMGREVVVAITAGKLDFGPWEHGLLRRVRRPPQEARSLIKVIGE